jgi:ubiquinone/menaquinone biosynthesis C-methylase UbiE
MANAPLSHSLFRAAELADFNRTFEEPILDLGCGMGEFAEVVMQKPIDYGLDICAGRLKHARRTGKYRRLCHADARTMPLAENCFATVLSVSAMEHMSDPEQVNAEVFRILRPGGVFVGTLVLSNLHRNLLYPRLLRQLGLRWLARVYIRLQDYLFQHKTLLTEETWRLLWREAGFETVECHKVVSPRITRLWDLMLPLAFPYWLGRKIGLNLMWHQRWLMRWFESALAAEHEAAGVEGSCLSFVLRKPGPAAGNPGEPCPVGELAWQSL